ncbi:hypothetical protein WA158_005402 [Blastocystis sp. Blastoise]
MSSPSLGNLPISDPVSWKVYGAQNSYTQEDEWILLSYITNYAFVDRNQNVTFSLRSNRLAFKQFKLVVENSTSSSSLALSLFTINICNYASVSTSLTYPTITSIFYGEDPIDIYPLSSGYWKYTSSPSLPTGVTMDYISGRITGMTTFETNGLYTISALPYSSNISVSAVISLRFMECSKDRYTFVRFRKQTREWGTEEGYYLQLLGTSAVTTIYLSPPFQNYKTYTVTKCIQAETLLITLTDTLGDGWGYKAYLTVYLLNGDEQYEYQQFYLSDSFSVTYYMNTKMAITNKSLTWKYVKGQYPSNWYAANSDADAGFIQISYDAAIPSADIYLWLFRGKFTYGGHNSTNFHSFILRMYLRAGVVVFINGKEVFRYRLGEDLNINTHPTSGSGIPSWHSVTGPLDTFVTGENYIAIGIFNDNTFSIAVIDFDCNLILSSTSDKLTRNWDITPVFLLPYTNEDAFFDLSRDYDCVVTVDNKVPITLSLNFPVGRAEFINKYCFVSNTNNPHGDPASWNLFGSLTGENYVKLDERENIFFNERGEEKCFPIINDMNQPWLYYNVVFTSLSDDESSPYIFALSEIRLLIENYKKYEERELLYIPSTIISYVNLPFFSARPQVSYFTNFEIVGGTLPAGLRLDSSTGLIVGTPTSIMQTTDYIIKATFYSGTVKQTTISITIDTCEPPMTLYTVYVRGGRDGSEQGIRLVDRGEDPNVYLEKDGVQSDVDNYYHVCTNKTIQQITLYDHDANGWEQGFFKLYLNWNTFMLQGGLGKGYGYTIFPLSSMISITPQVSTWYYLDVIRTVEPNWIYSSYNEEEEGWNIGTSMEFPNFVGNTAYFKHRFSLNHDYSISSIYVNIKSRVGVVAYLNGVELFRENMPQGKIDSTTSANIIYSQTKVYGGSFFINNRTIIILYEENQQNVLSVEVHKCKDSENNLYFDSTVYAIQDNSWRLIEGTATSDLSSDNQVDKLFDNHIGTLALSGPRCVGASFIYTFKDRLKEYISQYSITSGPYCNRRHPSGWKLEASNDGDTWVLLHAVENARFTSFRQTLSYSFYNEVSYHMFRYTSTECNNLPLEGTNLESDDICIYPESELAYGFQLADISLYSHIVYQSCNDKEYGGAVEEGYAYKTCPEYYEGRYERQCIRGNYTDERNYCSLMEPESITYPTNTKSLQIGESFHMTPQIEAAEYSCSIEPTLPSTVTFDTYEGTIGGSFQEVFTNVRYRVTCKNSVGSVATILIFTCENTVFQGILIGVIVGIALLLLVIFIVFLILYTKWKREQNLQDGEFRTRNIRKVYKQYPIKDTNFL